MKINVLYFCLFKRFGFLDLMKLLLSRKWREALSRVIIFIDYDLVFKFEFKFLNSEFSRRLKPELSKEFTNLRFELFLLIYLLLISII